MEKRMKILYVITIIAILAFLGMQVYWLYGRYQFSLRECEDDAKQTMLETLAEYKEWRIDNPDSSRRWETHQANYNINNDIIGGDSAKIKRKATIRIKKYNKYELLGLKERRKLTDEEKQKVDEIVENCLTKDTSVNGSSVKFVEVTFDADNAPSEAAVWGAFKDLELEMDSPFTTEGIDSLLQKKGISADINLVTTDSMVWEPEFVRHTSVFRPVMSLTAPYSELERKSVMIEWLITPSQVFGNMLESLIAVAVLSLFLVICLVWQFSTILKLTRIDRMRNDFVHTMIHELKRPISTLKMCVSSIENERMMADKAVKSEVMADCREALNNLSAYFSRLRDITFNEAGQIPLNFSSFSMRDMVSDAIGKCVAPSGKIVELKDVSAEDTAVVCDRLHLSQILGNLIENAVKYSGDRVEIAINYGVDAEGRVYLSVSDDGNGISEGDCRHLFDKFYRGKGAIAGGQPGMGLGLAYVKLLAEAHGGTVEVESKEGEGSRFTVKIPQS